MSEVNRWLIFDIANRTFNFDEDQEMVLAADHDRIVAEMQKQIEKLEAALTSVVSEWKVETKDSPCIYCVYYGHQKSWRGT